MRGAVGLAIATIGIGVLHVANEGVRVQMTPILSFALRMRS
jgi:hypothetical protein